MALRCPLLMAACIVRNGDALHAEADCAEDKCMWWSEEHGECFIPAFLNEILVEILVDGVPIRIISTPDGLLFRRVPKEK